MHNGFALPLASVRPVTVMAKTFTQIMPFEGAGPQARGRAAPCDNLRPQGAGFGMLTETACRGRPMPVAGRPGSPALDAAAGGMEEMLPVLRVLKLLQARAPVIWQDFAP